MRRLAAAFVSVLALSGLLTGPASGSGDPGPSTIFIDREGGTAAERAQLYKGRVGVLHTTASDGLLYLQWRLLNGLPVGQKAGEALNASCCDMPVNSGADTGVYGWADATRLVSGGTPAPAWIPTELPGPRYTRIPNCFADAFDTATKTLRERIARYGAGNPAVRAWLATQNAVFEACSNRDAALPAPMANAPGWLRADRAYQEAAFALYKGQTGDAVRRFRAIAADRSSPWCDKGLYLSIRALHRAALAQPSPAAFAATRAAIAELQAKPEAYGYGEVRGMLRSIAYIDHPEQLFDKIDAELHAREPVADIAKGLRDYVSLSARRTPRPDIPDWLGTLHSYQQGEALAHATERWTSTRKLHWLLAALSLVPATDPQAQALARDAAAVPENSPGWLTAQYHEMRLTFAHGDAAVLRGRIEAILAQDLSVSDRNLFRGMRAQLATSLSDLMRFAMRTPLCSDFMGYCQSDDRIRWNGMLARQRGGAIVAIGPETRAILDRLPLRTRMAAGATLPELFRLDLALTNYGRAVQLQDNAAIDRLAGELAGLMPLIRHDWLTIRRTRPGPAKRFAEYFVLAKLPGATADLASYTRPQGTIREWQGSWSDWMILPAGVEAPQADPPALTRQDESPYWPREDEADKVDIACFRDCGLGNFPLRMPGFAAAGEKLAERERDRYMFHSHDKPNVPAGTLSAWQSLYDYARAHPRDPRSPEALYWLIRISHWGHVDDRLGYRAFRLLHTRHRGSAWTKRSPFYYD